MTQREASGHPYFIDANSPAEMARLTQQDRIVTKHMGGLLTEQVDPSRLHDILDIACGPGGWVLDLAFMYPESEVTGIDISEVMIEYACTQAQVQNLENTKFLVMDALKPLQFSDSSFDLVNARMIHGFVPKLMWPALLAECRRILRPGGILRLTQDEKPITTSLAFEQFSALGTQAVFAAGQSFSPDGRLVCVTTMLPRLLRDAGYQNVQYRAHAIEFSSGSQEHQALVQNWRVAFKLLQPFLVRMKVAQQEVAENLYQQLLEEVQREDFCGLWYFLTAWGIVPM